MQGQPRLFRTMTNNIERHPLSPFLPQQAQLLMLGSFPPKQERWSMDFFYPNWINDMWRIMGIIFYDDAHHFEIKGEKRFDRTSITDFCNERGIALYDTALEVRRLRDNASDKYLEIVTPTDISLLLQSIPLCHTIVTTGEKATDTICNTLQLPRPQVGGYSRGSYINRNITLYRMPSSSRAYPMSLHNKAAIYRTMFRDIGMI